MRVARYLFRLFPVRFGLAVALAIISGLLGAAIIRTIESALGDGASSLVITAFVTLAVARLFTAATSQILLHFLSNETLGELRMRLCGAILKMPLKRVEEVGAPRLLGALTEDAETLGDATAALVLVASSGATVAGGLAYMAWLAPTMFACVVLLAGLGILVVKTIERAGNRAFGAGVPARMRAFRGFQAITRGTKELKLKRARRDEFFASHDPSVGAFHQSVKKGSTLWQFTEVVELLVSFMVLAFVLFLAPRVFGIGRDVVSAYVLTVLYLLAPLGTVLYLLPNIGRANLALTEIDKLQLSLDISEKVTSSVEEPSSAWRSVELVGVVEAYRAEADDKAFSLGPIDLTLEPGEIVFLTGGNGSGKSTLAKVLVGLYLPERGEVRIDGRRVDAAGLDHYRAHFSAIFSDFFLFDSLEGIPRETIDRDAQRHLAKLRLDTKVKIRDGRFSTTRLSQGQRKRLALVVAYLEGSPIYVFDEWAADQDPSFKKVFYTELLPELKSAGKTVICISHDDHYFHVADRRIHLEEGRIVDPVAQGAS